MSEAEPRPTTVERLPTMLPTNVHLRTLAEAATSAAERHTGTAFCEWPHTCGGCHWWAGYLWALNEADSGVEAQLATARAEEREHALEAGRIEALYWAYEHYADDAGVCTPATLWVADALADIRSSTPTPEPPHA